VAACAVQNGLPFLTVALRAEGLSLAAIGLLVSAPTAGLVLSLLAWGAAADRYGERLVLGAGLGIAAAALTGAALADTPPATGLWLLLAGAGSASVHAASGRLVLGWFPRLAAGPGHGDPAGRAADRRRGGGVRAAAAGRRRHGDGVRRTGRRVRGHRRPGRGPGARPGAAAGARGAPPAASPYRSPVLWRVHAASTLLVVPQFVVAAFGFDFLVRAAGWSVGAAGTLLAVTQLGGAAARLGAGAWSDRAGSRVGPLRLVAVAVTAVVGVLAVVAALTPDVLAPAVVAAAVVLAAIATVSPNGIAFTSVAEQAGSAWAGRALGAHNTVQNVSAALTVPLAALLVESGPGYPAAFAAGAVAAALAVGVVPGRAVEAASRGAPPAVGAAAGR
jgi:MFS family permease